MSSAYKKNCVLPFNKVMTKGVFMPLAFTKKIVEQYTLCMDNKHFFLSANTDEGFCNCFNFSLVPNKNGYVFVLKGGPGTGKSTLIKRVGEYFAHLGEGVEFFHCSFDPASLDGVRLTSRNVAIIDGTSPHIMESNIVGVDSKVINLGSSISDNIRDKRKKIAALVSKKKQAMSYFEKILCCAGKLYETNAIIEKKSEKTYKIDKIFNKIVQSTCVEPKKTQGSRRNMFRTIITEEGEKNFDNINSFKKVFKVKLGVISATELFERLADFYAENGFDVICFYDYLSLKNIESLYVEQVGALIKRENIRLGFGECKDLELYVNNEFMIENLLFFAGKYLCIARSKHIELENIYSDYIDFSFHKTITSEIISDIKSNFSVC